MVIIFGILLNLGKNAASKEYGWVPPYLLDGTNLNARTVAVLAALGVIIMMPEIITELKKKISAPGFMEQMGQGAIDKFNQNRGNRVAMAPFNLLGGAALNTAGGITAGINRSWHAPKGQKMEAFGEGLKAHMNENIKRDLGGAIFRGSGGQTKKKVMEAYEDYGEFKRQQSTAQTIKKTGTSAAKATDDRWEIADRWLRNYRGKYQDWKREGKMKIPNVKMNY
jgi:hypothetical protein